MVFLLAESRTHLQDRKLSPGQIWACMQDGDGYSHFVSQLMSRAQATPLAIGTLFNMILTYAYEVQQNVHAHVINIIFQC